MCVYIYICVCVCVCVCVCEIRYKRSSHKALDNLQCRAGKDREGRALVMDINVAAVSRVRYNHILLW